MRLLAAGATTSGVERDTGSDHGVGQPAAHPLVDQRGRKACRSVTRCCPCRTRSHRRPAAALHTTRGAAGRRSCSCTGSPRRALRAVSPGGRSDFEVVSRTFRSRPLSDPRRPARDWNEAAGLSARPEAGPVMSAIRSADGAACIWPCKDRTSSHARHRGGASGHPGRGRSPASPGRGRPRARPRSNGAATPSCPIPRHMARGTPLRPSERGAGRPAPAPRQFGCRPGRLAADHGDRRPGTALGPPRRLEMPILRRDRRARREVPAHRRARPSAPSGATPAWRSWPAQATRSASNVLASSSRS